MTLNYKFFTTLFFVACFVGCKEEKKTEKNPIKKDSIEVVNNNQTQTQVEVDSNAIFAETDISPMDMSYFPVRFPQQKMATNTETPPVMRVIYSRPHLQGRKLFEEIIKFGDFWRLGANEATELNVFQPITIGEKKIPVGRYTLYAIPKAGYWTIIVNSNLDIWGLKHDASKDVVSVRIPVKYYNPVIEYFTMFFEKSATGANLVIAWDDVVAKLPIKI